LLRRIPDEIRQELLENLGFLPDEVDRISEEDLGRGIGEILENYLIHVVLKLEDRETLDLHFHELPAETQRDLRIVDEVIGIVRDSGVEASAIALGSRLSLLRTWRAGSRAGKPTPASSPSSILSGRAVSRWHLLCRSCPTGCGPGALLFATRSRL
jgi:hypothetical protein